MLGIIIGVSSVVIMMAIWQGTSSKIVDRVSSMGANLITLSPGKSSSNVRSSSVSSDLIDDDFLAQTEQIPWIKSVAPTVSASKQFIYWTYNANAQVLWVTPAYQTVKNLTVENGRFINQNDVTNMTDSAVIWQTLATNAFNGEDPIGKEIKLQNNIYTVVWVFAKNSNVNSKVVLPISTVMYKIVGTHYYSSLTIEVTDTNEVDSMMTLIADELNKYLGITNTDDQPFTVSSMSEMLESMQEISSTMTLFLGWIGAISLIVWGIGVMNIMLVSVTERTREIGIRKAIGATRMDILYQFLVESIIISLLAGSIGIGWSFFAVAIINKFTTAVISTNSVLIAFSAVVVIWVFFWLLPAYKAAQLKPIDALRFE